MRATEKGARLWVQRRELLPKLAQALKGDNPTQAVEESGDLAIGSSVDLKILRSHGRRTGFHIARSQLTR